MSQPGSEEAQVFSIARGAPFLRFQERLGLVGPGSLAAARRGLFFAALCWLPLLVLAAVDGTLLSPGGGGSLLLDLSAYARFLAAVPIFLLIEPLADVRIARVGREFVAGGLVPRARIEDFESLVADANRRRDSGLAEAVIAGVSALVGSTWVRASLRLASPSWAGRLAEDGAIHLSPAGWWAALVASPVFLFLLLRWLWRFLLWVLLMRRIAALGIEVVPTHPDRCGGLAFVGQYPAAFSGFAFAISTVVAAALARLLLWGGTRIEDMQWAVGAWVVAIFALFLLPLFFFARPLRIAKQQALLDYAALSLRHNRAFEQRWIRGTMPTEEMLGSQDPSSLADLATAYQAVKAMRGVPVVAEGLVPLAIAVALPLACAAATQVPVRTMLMALRKFVL